MKTSQKQQLLNIVMECIAKRDADSDYYGGQVDMKTDIYWKVSAFLSGI